MSRARIRNESFRARNVEVSSEPAGAAAQLLESGRRHPVRVREGTEGTPAEGLVRTAGACVGDRREKRDAGARDSGIGAGQRARVVSSPAMPRPGRPTAQSSRTNSCRAATLNITRIHDGGCGSPGLTRCTTDVGPSTTVASAGTGDQPARAKAPTSAAISLAHELHRSARAIGLPADDRPQYVAQFGVPAAQVGDLMGGLVDERGRVREIVPGDLDRRDGGEAATVPEADACPEYGGA